MEDGDLVARAREGDGSALGALYRLHRARVVALARRLTGDASAAEDVAQEAFLSVMGALPSFRGEARFSTWLHRIVVNRALSHRRRHALEAAPPGDVPCESSGLDPAEQAELRDRLTRAIDGLVPSLRQVFLARELDGDSTARTGERLALAPPNVRIRLYRAKHFLRQRRAGAAA